MARMRMLMVRVGGVMLLSTVLVLCENVYSKQERNLLPLAGSKNVPFLNHLLIHNDVIYVAGINWIFKLNFNLSVLANVSTGPQNDSIVCDLPPTGDRCRHPKSLRDNVNKVLLLHESRGIQPTLITCGSIFQGACETRFASNLQLSRKYYGQLDSMTGDLSVQDVYAIAADTENGSTVAYIAPGPSGSDVMYVASTYTGTNNRLIRLKVPAISTRRLWPPEKIFSFSYLNVSPIKTRASRLFIKESVRTTFLVDYVAGFTSGNFSYFVTTQPKSESKKSSNRITKLIHLCQQDNLFTSYVDLPLMCKDDTGKLYNTVTSARVIQPAPLLQKNMQLQPGAEEVLVATFTDDSDNSSAVCVFGMGEIRRKVIDNAKLCRTGNSSTNGNKYIEGGSDCRRNPNLESETAYLCNNRESDYFNRIAGILGVEARPVITYENLTLTSIALSTTTDFTVAFIGTNSGSIKKLVINSKESATEYDTGLQSDLTIDPGSPLNKDMYLDPTNQYLVAMSEKKVAILRVENCERYSNCHDCLSSKDPYCGWCTLENRCTVRTSCTKPDVDRWSNGVVGNCISIMDTSPPSASTSEVLKVHLSILKLPMLTNYSCVFALDGGLWSVPAERWSYGLTCQTPNVTDLGLHFGEQGYRDIKLSINSTEAGKLFVSKNFTFYNCKSFKSCSPCTDNRWSCDWCVYENKCLFNSANCDVRGIIVSRNGTDDDNSTRYSGEGRRGPNHCPRVDRSKTEPVYIPDMKSKSIIIKGFNFPESFDGMPGYRSVISIPDSVSQVTASCQRLDSEILSCPIPQQKYEFIRGSFRADLRVYFGNNIEVENDATQVIIYSCTHLAGGDCSFCKNMQNHQVELNCAWCHQTCEYREFCGDSRPQLLGKSEDTCPAPQITSINPNTGTKMGGTMVTLSGTNLGTEFKDIRNNVSIAGVPCTPIEELYRPSRRIVCKVGPSTGRPEDKGDKSGAVTVLNYVFNNIVFHYLSPSIEKVTPRDGPKSGGSFVTISGLHLNAGNKISITINNRSCEIIGSVSVKSVTCSTPPSPRTEDEMIRAVIDGNVIYGSLMFRYYEDPTITDIFPLRSFSSGGRNITVLGTNFTIIQRPQMFVVFQSRRTKESDCYVFNSTLMKCPAPQMNFLQGVERTIRSTLQLSAQIGFIMDNVLAVQNLSKNFPSVAGSLEYFSDPVVYNFTEQGAVKEFKGEVLIIRGQGFDTAATKEDVQVWIGASACNVTNLVENEIYCTPPTTQPQSIKRNGFPSENNAPQVIVKIGNREYLIGFLAYETPSPAGSMLIYIIIGVVAIVVVIILAIIIFSCFYHRQKTRSRREFHKMQIQLDSMESNVRNECRQAFAELQTDMTDLTNDLDASKKPFYSFESYTFNVLFPGMLDHVILHPPMQKNGNIDRHPDIGIVHFNQLLQNKHFLLLLIRTLERQKSFSIRDKSNVASLLMILYQNNMEYATEILKALLSDLVEKSVESRHPKLMLRRTESVVEKLLANWLSLCLYKYLVDSAGSSLYILYKAIKVQVEKGPIDHVTCDARYSLSEDRLLRTEFKLEAETLNLNLEFEGKRYKCRVLDCDTITQAKEKMLDTIFRNFPYSQRPLAADLDLELSNSGRMMLDEDNTTLKMEGWKQLNTLKHYKVLDCSEMVLTQHQNCRTMPRSPNGSVHSSGFSFREQAPIARTECEVGTKIWHLVKQHDDCNNGGGLKMSSEIYLTRLLATKGTLKQYIDDFFEMVLKVDSSLPPVIKYLFDMMDHAASHYNITDPDVVHTWKCNSLLLRFWVNIIKNPNFVYDIHKPSIVDSCLSVVAQTFMDSCSTSEHRLGKDSPSNKLLFAKDIPKYRKWVEKYFSDIQNLPPVSDQDLNAYLADVSRMSTGHFTKENALYELYNYVQKYNNEINESLEMDGCANAQQLPAKLGHVITAMEGPSQFARDYV